jgi:DNA-directed RNA polymerase specialized sigma24 family protein
VSCTPSRERGRIPDCLAFPPTRRSVVLAFRSPDPEERTRAFDALAQAYWGPVYKHLRARWGTSDEDAEDLAQGFFTAALEKGYFEGFDPVKGRFRTYLLTCLDAFSANDHRSRTRLKRGGRERFVPLETAGADGGALEVSDGRELEADFQREWARSLFALAVESLRGRCRGTAKEVAFELFEEFDLEGSDPPERPSYAELAARRGLAVTQVTNHLAWARREFRRGLLEKLREITASDDEFRAEARTLLGFDPP